MSGFVGRFAPSPTGLLHLGNARSALLGWLQARHAKGRFLLRIEDLDPDRSKPEQVRLLEEDLHWLGLDFDPPTWRQSERAEVYREALERLKAEGRAYPCWCSRAEVAAASSAPHPGEEGPRYPGTCAALPAGAPPPAGKESRSPAWRFRVEPGVERFDDGVHGAQAQDVAAVVGDFVVCRADGVAAYQLAVVVDDALSGVTDVLRADDLLGSTFRQLQLYRALGYPAPRFAHVPLLLGEDGHRLAKRSGALTLRALKERGVEPRKVVGWLAHSAGLSDGRPVPAPALVEEFSLQRLTKSPFTVLEAQLP